MRITSLDSAPALRSQAFFYDIFFRAPALDSGGKKPLAILRTGDQTFLLRGFIMTI
jgi:hypothetical protein